LYFQLPNSGIRSLKRINENAQERAGYFWQFNVSTFNRSHEFAYVCRALRNNKTELGQVAAQGIYELRALSNQQIPSFECQTRSLIVFAPNLHKPHRWSQCSFTKGFSVNRITLAAFYKRFDIFRSDQTN
jgi:hypothetical protein